MSASRVDFLVRVLGDVHRVASKACAFPDEAALLGEKGWHFATDKLVADGLLAVRVQLVSIGHFPGAAGGPVVVGHGLERGGELGLLRVEGVAVLVFGAAYLPRTADCIDLEDGVVGAVDVRVNSQAEQVLVVVSVDAGVDLGAPAFGVLAGAHGVGVQDTGQLDLELDRAVLVEDPVHAVLVVGGSEDVGDDQFAAASNHHRVVSEIGVFEEDAGVFLVNANGVLDDGRCTGAVDERCVHIMDGPLAVAPQRQAIGHVATSILSEIKGMFPLVRVFRVAVWDHHLCQRETVEDRTNMALVVECDVVQNNSLAVVKADMDIPVLPCNFPALDLERDTLRLSDVNRLDIVSEAAFLLHCGRVVIARGSLANRPSHWGHVDVDDLLGLCVVDGAEVQWEGVLGVVDVRAVVHKSLLQPNSRPKSLVIANCPC